MHFCAFSMQNGNYRVYTTIPREKGRDLSQSYDKSRYTSRNVKRAKVNSSEFSKNDQDLLKNHTETTIVVYGYFPGSTDLWWVDCRSDDFQVPYICSFCVLIYVFRDCECFCCFCFDRNILWAKSPHISGRTDDLLRTIFGTFCVFPVNHLSENLITTKRKEFCHQYSPSTIFCGFYLIGQQPSHGWVILKI